MKHVIIGGLLSIGMAALPGFYGPASAQTGGTSEVEALREQVRTLQETVGQLQQTMQTMRERMDTQARQGAREAAPRVETARDGEAVAPARVAASPLDDALGELNIPDAGSQQPALWRQPLGRNAQFRLIDISTDVLLYAGGSSERDASLSTLQGGAHDPTQRGFTLGQAEISLSGAVDPFFTGEAHLLTSVNPSSGETTFEIEEAFLTSSALPYGLQLEAGHMLTEFGILNAQHPHAWDWIDQPVVHSRMFGGDGLRQTGVRASWIAPTPWFSEIHFGVQNATGATMASFLGGELVHDHGGGGGHDDHAGEGHDDHEGEDEDHEGEDDDHEGEDDDHDYEGEDDDHGHEGEHEGEDHDEHAIEGHGIGGRPIVDQDVRGFGDFTYLARWEHAFDLSDELTAVFGASGLYGPNSTGRDGDTWLYGLDMKWRWTPADSFRGYPFLTWQTEIIKRDYHAARYTTESEDGDVHSLPGTTLKDWGLYSQLLYGFHTNWAAGLRLEYAGGGGHGNNDGGRRMDPFRDDRYRVSPLLVWRPTEFSRIRLQYNFDSASHLANDAHGVWLGFEWLYGAHPAHDF